MKPNSQRWSQWLSRVSTRQIDMALALLVTAAGLLLFAFAGIGGNRGAGFLFLQNVEQSLLDTRFELRGARQADERIVIVGIDEKTLQHEGSFPLPRRSYANLVKRLNEEGARVVAFDATFPTPESNSATQALDHLEARLGAGAPPNVNQEIKRLKGESDQDGAFAASLKTAGNVVLGHLFLDNERAKNADPKLEEEYFNIVWAKSFPQVLKVKSKDGKDFDLEVTPEIPQEEQYPRIGIAWDDNYGIVLDTYGKLTRSHPTPLEQVRAATLAVVNTFGAIASPKSDVKLQHMSGPVMMLRVYYLMFENRDGWLMAFWFSVVLNVNLALLNLIPMPVLDGGHITLAIIEALRRRPVNARVLEIVQTACAVLIIGFMVYIAFFDVQDLFGRAGPKFAPKSTSSSTR